MARIDIFDTTLRDGEQSPGASMTPPEKLRLAHQLEALGVDIIEAGFPITSEDDFKSVQTIAREVRGPAIAGLARAVHKDIERAAAALEGAHRARLHTFLATSPIHLQHKLKISEAECLDRAAEAVRFARTLVDEVEFSAEDALRSDLPFLARVVEVVIQAGAKIVNIPDTVGYAYPEQIRRTMRTLIETVPGIDGIVLSTHCHNDLGLAVANSLAAIEAGARQVECTINGIGERAGNTALEEIVMALVVRQDAFGHTTGVNTREIHRSSQLLSFLTGINPQPNKAIVGKNAFAHEAGIHQDGVLKERTTYEIMTPELVGVPESQLVLGKHSGRHALDRRYRELGYELTAENLNQAYKLFKLLADQKKSILDEDLISILHHGTMEDVPTRFKLHTLDISCGKRPAEARVKLVDNGEETDLSVSVGDGPIAAAFDAINVLLPFRPTLDDLQIQANPGGVEAVGEVRLRLKVEGKTFTGRGASPDVVVGAVRAYLHAINKATHALSLEGQALARPDLIPGNG
ncbi:MAG: 2-isopropylmalate synthase [Gemmatimonadota bacterium]|jgi:2-isopropylmalate synthase|nr:2-isopropylmalate synthase [Gemmatimonadota bacterium]